VWKTGYVQQVVMLITFVAALLIPLQYAVLLGVALAVVLYVFRQSNKITIVEWKVQPGQLPVESDVPEVVPSNQATLLVPYGSLFYAAAPVFESQLPKVTEESRRAAIIIALREKSEVGSTFLEVLARYANDLREHESTLMLAGVNPKVFDQISRTEIIDSIGRENIFLATEKVGESATEAFEVAKTWIKEASEAEPAAGLAVAKEGLADAGPELNAGESGQATPEDD
jgi:SulP family sulfate permease